MALQLSPLNFTQSLQLTCCYRTANPSILIVVAISSVSVMRAVEHTSLWPSASHIIHYNGTTTWTKHSVSKGCSICSVKEALMSTLLSLQWDRINTTKLVIVLLILEKPSCLQTTVASVLSHPSWHTVPQAWPMQTSTRPSLGPEPPITLMSSFEQSRG